MPRSRHAMLMVATLAPALAALASAPQAVPTPSPAPAPILKPAGELESPWRIFGRASTRNIHRVLFLTGTETVTAPRATQGRKADVGSADAYADRAYDNGYVRQDAGTPIDGTTWHWGYTSSSQIEGDSIVFRAFDGYETAGTDSGNVPDAWKETDFSVPEFSVGVERILKAYPSANAGVRLNLSYLSFSLDEEFSGSQLIQNARYIEDTYALYGITPPTAPYSGSAGGPGPILDNRPVSRSIERRPAGTGGGVAAISESLDLDMVSVDLGFTLQYPGAPLVLTATVGPSFHSVQIRAKHVETAASGAIQHHSSSDSEWILGYFAEATAEIKVSSRLRVGASGRYDSIAETADQVGPSSFAVDLSGWSAGLVATIEL